MDQQTLKATFLAKRSARLPGCYPISSNQAKAKLPPEVYQYAPLQKNRTGTPLYKAPEVSKGDEYTPEAETYSMGVLTLEFACNRSITYLVRKEDLEKHNGCISRDLLDNFRRVYVEHDDSFSSGLFDLASKMLAYAPVHRISFSEAYDTLLGIVGNQLGRNKLQVEEWINNLRTAVKTTNNAAERWKSIVHTARSVAGASATGTTSRKHKIQMEVEAGAGVATEESAAEEAEAKPSKKRKTRGCSCTVGGCMGEKSGHCGCKGKCNKECKCKGQCKPKPK